MYSCGDHSFNVWTMIIVIVDPTPQNDPTLHLLNKHLLAREQSLHSSVVSKTAVHSALSFARVTEDMQRENRRYPSHINQSTGLMNDISKRSN